MTPNTVNADISNLTVKPTQSNCKAVIEVHELLLKEWNIDNFS